MRNYYLNVMVIPCPCFLLKYFTQCFHLVDFVADCIKAKYRKWGVKFIWTHILAAKDNDSREYIKLPINYGLTSSHKRTIVKYIYS